MGDTTCSKATFPGGGEDVLTHACQLCRPSSLRIKPSPLTGTTGKDYRTGISRRQRERADSWFGSENAGQRMDRAGLLSLTDSLALANQSHSSSLPRFTHLYIRHTRRMRITE